MYLAENLKFLREQRGKTQQELAKLFGVEQKTFVITLHQYCICPRCNHILNAGPDYQPDYCSKCGQHVNCSDVPWEEEVQLGYVRKEERCE